MLSTGTRIKMEPSASKASRPLLRGATAVSWQSYRIRAPRPEPWAFLYHRASCLLSQTRPTQDPSSCAARPPTAGDAGWASLPRARSPDQASRGPDRAPKFPAHQRHLSLRERVQVRPQASPVLLLRPPAPPSSLTWAAAQAVTEGLHSWAPPDATSDPGDALEPAQSVLPPAGPPRQCSARRAVHTAHALGPRRDSKC